MNIVDIFKNAIDSKASDIFIIAGRPMSYKIMGEIVSCDDTPLSADDSYRIICDIFKIANQESLDLLAS
ncbi:MAG: type IV pili twitching motility protein PilT, partial [Sedimentibacter sp.]